MIKNYQNSNPKIMQLEQQLEDLKSQRMARKELQSERNRFTAQLSRDRQKLEMTFLKSQCVNYHRLLKKLNQKLAEKDQFCCSCKATLQKILKIHQIPFGFMSVSDVMEDMPATKRVKK